MAVTAAVTAIVGVIAAGATAGHQASVQHREGVKAEHAKNDQLDAMAAEQQAAEDSKKREDIAAGNAVSVARQRAVAGISAGSSYGGTLGSGAQGNSQTAAAGQKQLLGQ